MRPIIKIPNVAFALLILCLSKITLAQQDPLYTQYMDNLLIINPGFAGSQQTGSLMVVSRNQWVSFDGAPSTRSLSFHTPLKSQNIGLGFSILNDRIGPQKQTGIYLDYSYMLRISENYKMGMGLKGGIGFYRSALTELNPIYPDPIYAKDIYKNFLPNFGFGMYLYSSDTYLGLSVPNLIRNTVRRDEYLTDYMQKEEIHVYLMGGKKFILGQGIQLKTYTLFRYVNIAPLTWDITTMFGFRDKFWVGPMFRLGDSYGILAQFKISEKMLVGYSYDLTYSELNAFNNGTHEIMFNYNFNLFK